jgi:type I restriction enzyme S subunit
VNHAPDERRKRRRLGWLFQTVSRKGHPDEMVLSVFRDHGVVPKDSRSDNFNRTPENLTSYQLVEPGDLVVNRMKAWQGSLGISPHRGIVSPDYEVLRPVTADAEPRYLHQLLRSRPLIDQYGMRSTGIRPSQWRLYWDQMKTIEVNLPSAEQQHAIANYLDHETTQIDTLIAKQAQLIATLKERRSAVVEDALEPTGPCTTMSLKFALDGVDQGVSPQADAGLADEPGTWGVLKSGAVNHGVFRQEEHKRLPADFGFDPKIAVAIGDVIVSRASGSPDLVGSCGLVERLDYQLILSDKLFRLRPAAGTDPRFLGWLLNGRRYRTQVRQSISGAEGLANNLPLRALLSFRFAMPLLDEQQRVVAYLDEQTAKIDTLIAKAERFIELSKERRASLITAAVTGQIDVRTSA